MLQRFLWGKQKDKSVFSMLVKIYFDSWDVGNMTSHVDIVAVLQSCCRFVPKEILIDSKSCIFHQKSNTLYVQHVYNFIYITKKFL